MPQIILATNKKLVLKNVLRRELQNIEFDKLNDEINKFGILLDKLSVQTFGPLVTKNGGVNINNEGTLTTDYDLLVQAHDYKQYKSSFEVIERLEVLNCIYVRFEGNPDEVQFAHSKLDLYFYENDLESTDEIYSIMVEDSEHHSIIDIFRPVRIL